MENKLKIKSIVKLFASKIFAISLLIFSTSNAFAKDEKKVNKQEKNKLKQVVDETPLTEDKDEENDRSEGTKGIISSDVYTGAVSTVKFKFRKEDSEKESRVSTSLTGFIGAKSEFNVPDLPFPVKSEVKIKVTKKDFELNDFKVVLPLAYFDIWKFKLGIAESLFNSKNTSIPQFRFTWEFDNGLTTAFGIEASSSKAYFNNSDMVRIRKDGRKGDDYNLKKIDYLPVAAVLNIKYKLEDVFDTSIAFLAKPMFYDIEATSTGDKGKDGKPVKSSGFNAGWGINFNSSVYLLSKWSQLKFGVMIGQGAGSAMSDFTSKYIIEQEEKRPILFNLRDNKIDYEKEHFTTLFGLRTNIGITQKIARSFAISLFYYLDIAGQEFERMYKPFLKKKEGESKEDKDKRIKNTGYEKIHKIKADLTWDMNDEGKVKVSLGSYINILNEKNPFDVYGKLSFDFSK